MLERDEINIGRVKILAPGKAPEYRARTGGKLFEQMMTDVLAHHGYRVARIFNTDSVEMALNIEGEHKKTGHPFYADCRFSETAVSERDFQAFYGKYMTRWHKNKQCHGLFIALPGIDDSARKFYQEHIEKNSAVTTILYEEEDVIKALSKFPESTGPDTLVHRIPGNIGKPADYCLLYTEKGVFRVWFIISPGKKNPDRMALFDNRGLSLSDSEIIDYLNRLYPMLGNLENISIVATTALQPGLFRDTDEIVEVKGGPECFEYRFPASSSHFVGRKSLLNELDSFVKKVINKETGQRAVLFEGPSGCGKSSVVLASVARIQEQGHFAVAIDARTAASSTFIPQVIRYTIEKFGDFDGMVPQDHRLKSTADFDGAVRSILEIGQLLESQGKLLVIFFDPFENISLVPDVLKSIKEFILKIYEKQTNLVLGLSWRKDVVSSKKVFPDERLNLVLDSSKKMVIGTFTRKETHALLKKLSDELDEPLSKGLRSFLMEFSQGYPWLLKILCFHVKVARKSGIPQSDISENLLSLEELFQYDLQNLSDKERATLFQIAGLSSMRFLESDGIFDFRVVQNLIHYGPIVKIGNTLDVYGNIFRGYLNRGILPFYDNYILCAKSTDVLHGIKILHEAGGFLGISQFKEQTGLSERLFYGLAKDMDLLGLVKFIKGTAALQIKISDSDEGMPASLRKYLQNRLRSNRPVQYLLNVLKDKNRLTIPEVSKLIEISFPDQPFAGNAGLRYTRILAEWVDVTDLALWDKKNGLLIHFDPSTEIRERQLILFKRRGGKIPRIHYGPMENVIMRLVQSLYGDRRVDWTGLGKNTIFRALATLEDIGFIIREAPLIKVLPQGKEFAENPDRRPSLFAAAALQMPSFSIFVEILESHQIQGNTLSGLGFELAERLGANWKENTAVTIAKIMLNWARHAKLAPGVFEMIRKGPIKGWKKKNNRQMTLF